VGKNHYQEKKGDTMKKKGSQNIYLRGEVPSRWACKWFEGDSKRGVQSKREKKI